MNTVDIITKKRDKYNLTQDEIKYMITGAVNGSIPDYQLSAFLMASFINGLNDEETFYITKAMLESGEILDFSEISGIKTDKHSTGGVGDTTTLILAPAVASLGVPVIKMSGRGLGFSGGTIDKLSAIPGFSTEISMEKAKELAKKSGIVLMGQSESIALADKIFYSLRDVTGTVESTALIVSSIMSKKLATGSDAIVFDVKCGSGAFMKDLPSARTLAKDLIQIGEKFNKKCMAVISSMSQPLGNYIGNSLEVYEAIDVLKGKTKGDLRYVSSVLGGAMLICAGKAPDIKTGSKMIEEAIDSGKALNKFKELIINQGGNPEIINDYALMPLSNCSFDILSPKDGYLSSFNTHKIGLASVETGAGRKQKTDDIDLGAGIKLNCRIGDYIKKGDVMATLYAKDETRLKNAAEMFNSSFELSDSKPEIPKLILDIIE